MKRFHFIILFYSIVTALASCKSLDIEKPDTVLTVIPKVIHENSTLNIPIEIDLKPYFKEIDNSIPDTIIGNEQVCDGVSYDYFVLRNPIKFSGQNNQLNFLVNSKYQLKLNYCPECTYLFDDKGHCIIPRVYASCGVGEAMRDMDITYSSIINLQPNWQFKSKTTLQKIKANSPCKVTFISYDATEMLIEEVEPILKDLEKDIDKSIQEVELRSTIEDVWQSLETPIDLDGYGFLMLNPKKIAMDDLQFKGNKALLSVNLELTPQINFDTTSLKHTPLPNLSKFTDKSGFEMTLDIQAKYDSIDQVLKRELVGQTFNIDKRVIHFEDVSIFSTENQKINIALKISGSAKGTLYFTGTPVFHSSTQELSIPDLTFNIKTRNALLKSAKWLFNEKIEQKLQDATKINLAQQLLTLQHEIEKELNQEITDGVNLYGKMNKLEILDIYPFTNQLFIRVRTKGELKIKL